MKFEKKTNKHDNMTVHSCNFIFKISFNNALKMSMKNKTAFEK